jgi:hypothetical protein
MALRIVSRSYPSSRCIEQILMSLMVDHGMNKEVIKASHIQI